MSTISPSVPPELQIRTSYPTPRIEDLLFYELRDERKAQNLPREYKTPHPEKKHHMLVHIEPSEEAPGWMRWWYAAKREFQHLYNYEITYPYGGRKEFPRITRTWIIPRDEYAPGTVGTDMDPVYTTAVLIDHNLGREEKILDGAFVVYTQVFDQLPNNTDVGAGKVDYGWKASYECYPDYPVVQWTFDAVETFTLPAYGAACPIPGFDGAGGPVLVDVTNGKEKSAISKVTLIYEVVPGRPKETQMRHPDFGMITRTTRKVFMTVSMVDYALPQYGDLATAPNIYVVDAKVEEENCRIGIEIIDTAVLPSTVKEEAGTHAEFCDTIERTWTDLKINLPSYEQGDTVSAMTVVSYTKTDTLVDKIGRASLTLAVVPSDPKITYSTDQETGKIFSISSQIVFSSSVPPDPVAGQDVTQTPIGCALSMRKVSAITLPAAREECTTLLFDFPSLLLDVNFATLTDEADNEYFAVHPVIRAGFRKKVTARVLIDYHTTQPACSDMFQIFPTNINYTGKLFALRFGSVVNNVFVAQANTSSGNPKWGVVVETVTHGASAPTLTEYQALVTAGTEVLIDEKIGPWKFNLYRRERYYITLE